MKLPIRFKLLLGFTILVVLSSFIQALTFSLTRQNINAEVNAHLLDKAQTAADQIDNFFTIIQSNNQTIAKTFEQNPTNSNQATITTIKNVFTSLPNIEQISLLSLTGKELMKFMNGKQISSDKLSYEIMTDQFNAAKTGMPALSDVYYIDKETSPHVDIFYPIFQDNNSVVGVLKMEIDFSQLWNIISKIKLGMNGYAYVIDSYGRIIAHPNQHYLATRPLVTKRPFVNALVNNQIGTVQPIDYLYTNEKNIPVIARAVKTQKTNWFIVFEQPQSEAFSFLWYIRNLYIMTLVGSIFLLLLLSFFLSENLTRSIRKLQSMTEHLEAGGKHSSISIKSGDEIELLANSFNVMTNQLIQREELLTKEKQEMETILESLTNGVIALDDTNTILLINRAAENILSLQKEAVINQHIDHIFHAREHDELILFEKITNQETVFKKKLTDNGIAVTTNNGTVKYLSVLVSPVRFGQAKTNGWILTFTDISKEKDLEEMKLDFVSMAAHELRTPLTSIRGYASLLSESEASFASQDVKEYLKRLIINTDNLGGLIDNLLNVSRIEQNSFTIDAYPINLVAIIKDCILNLSEQARTKGQILLFRETSEQLPLVLADTFRINQVLMNLIGNAISYTQEGGSITIDVTKKDAFLEVSIRDNGSGIPSEAIPKLFTKFFRVSGILEQGSKGTGLGLFITKSIITMHKGTIWVDSTIGKGSTFHFTLPIATADEILHYKEEKMTSGLTGKHQQGIIINKDMFKKRFGTSE